MWYVVDIIFAQQPREETHMVQCESCSVLFEALSALAAYDKATEWGKEHEKDNNFRYVGIGHLWGLEEERPGDGTEIGGDFFEEEDFWDRVEEFIPYPQEIPTVKLEANENTTIGELMSEATKEHLRKILGEDTVD